MSTSTAADAFKLWEGDCLSVMKAGDGWTADYFHACVTDPPSGTGFMNRDWDKDKGGRDQWIAWLASVMAECLRCLKPGGHALVWALPRTSHWTATAIEDAGFEIRDVLAHHFGQGFPKSHNLEGEYEGWGTALKPASEHWILARKPFPGTVAANMERHGGVGALNIDLCRVAGESWTANGTPTGGTTVTAYGDGLNNSGRTGSHDAGRWPTNVLLSHSPDCTPVLCAEGCPVRLMGEQSGERRSSDVLAGGRKTYEQGDNGWSGGWDMQKSSGYGDTGTAARFFPAFWPDTFDADPFIYAAKASRTERDAGTSEVGGNRHITVKPIALMRFLCRLICPPGGILLDPFAGSGSTGCACALEGFRFVGIDADPENIPLAEARIRHWSAQPRLPLFGVSAGDEEKPPRPTSRQMDIFTEEGAKK